MKDTSLNNDSKSKARVIDNLAYTKWLANDHENVLDDLLSVLNIRLAEKDLFGLIASYAHLSDYYKQKSPNTALKYATKMYKQAVHLNSPQDQLEAMQKLIELETSKKAKEYYYSYVKISDSINDAEKSTLNKFEKLKYDSEKNREENLQLKISTSVKELELEKEKTKNIITYTAGGSVFLVLLIFMYNRKQKHKIEKRTEVYNTETTIILKDIHKVALAEISKEKQIELYRILQELMVNMRKHSEASLVAITFKNNKNHYDINYSDNGIGLNLEELTFQNGLNNVETRIKSLNGTVTFDTALNNGFKAFISFKN